MASEQTTLSPHNQQPFLTRPYQSTDELDAIVEQAHVAQKQWSQVPLKQRIEIGNKFVEIFRASAENIPLELTLQMGRPVSQGPGEIRGFLQRAEYMLSIAESALADTVIEDTGHAGFKRYLKRVPIGVVLAIVPWNYPYLTSINSVLPAIIAGNAVILKPSPQTPCTAERFAKALLEAGVPAGVIQVTHCDPPRAEYLVKHPGTDFVCFTGSVKTGRAVETAAVANSFKYVALELGGKDPAYVRADADLGYTVGELVDGALFNSGQSCCAIERIYVHGTIYDKFVEEYAKLVKQYKLGDPTLPETNLGPVIDVNSANRIRRDIDSAVAAGAKTLIPAELFPIAQPGTAYVAPQVLVDVNHTMDIMTEETFGPVVGIMKVSGDEEALKLMNDSKYGLTASIWTDPSKPESLEAFDDIANSLESGTVFLNRCDYLDPALAWTGVKNSGRGVTLSTFGYHQFTKLKSIHMKLKIA